MFILLVVLFPVVAFFTWASLLGENNRMSNTIEQMLESASFEKDDCKILAVDSEASGEDHLLCDDLLILTISLKEYFNVHSDQYRVLIKRDRLWLPFSGNRELKLSVALIPIKNGLWGKLSQSFFGIGNIDYLNDLFTIERREGRWKLKRFSVKTSALRHEYQQTEQLFKRIDFHYLTADRVFEPHNISQLSYVERSIISYKLGKLIELVRPKQEVN